MKHFKRVVFAALVVAGALLGTSSALLAVPPCPAGYYWGWTAGYYWNGHQWAPRYGCMPFGWDPWWWSPVGRSDLKAPARSGYR